MMNSLKGLAIIVGLIGLGTVPPFDAPVADPPEEPQIAVYAEEAPEEEEITVSEEVPAMEYLGTFQATAYEWTGNPCANGEYPTEGYTIACNSLPLGTEVYIEGIGYRVVEDRGAGWHGSDWLDLYMGDEASCYAWGVRPVDVYIVR